MESEILSQVVVAGLSSYVMERAKKSPYLPFLTMETKRLNGVIAAIVSAVATIGIHFTYDSSAGTLMITGVGLTSLRHGLWDWAKQYLFQQFVYDTAIKNKTLGVKVLGG